MSQIRRRLGSMSLTKMESFDQTATQYTPLPGVPDRGARIRVMYAGACYRTRYLNNRSDFRVHAPGYEISGVIDELGSEVDPVTCRLQVNDRVVIYPFEKEGNSALADSGYPEFIAIPDLHCVVKIPDDLDMEVAAMLPCGGLRAFNAVCRARQHIDLKLRTNGSCTLVIVSAGGLGLWALRCTQFFYGNEKNLNIVMTDNKSEKLFHALDEGADDVIHWAESEHEGYLYERTRDVCQEGVDVAIDFVSSPRTLKRLLSVLNFEGLCVVAGNSGHEAYVSLQTLAINEQSLVGTQRGTIEMLQQLVGLVAEKKIHPPAYQIYPVSEADKAFKEVSLAKVKGRAILKVCLPEMEESEQ